MKILTFETNEEWLAARERRVTGSRQYKTITFRGNSKKEEYYQLIAERISKPGVEEDAMARGHRLEPEALDAYAEQIGKTVHHIDNVLWVREDNENIAVSPDGLIDGGQEAVEVKCLKASKHVQILLTQEIPKPYLHQGYQYFIVNDDLQKVHFVFYNPLLIVKQLFTITITREEAQEEIAKWHKHQIDMLAEIDEIVNHLTF